MRSSRSRRRHGSFASVPGQQREGSFADTDRDVVVSYDNGAERSRVVSDRELRRLPRAAAVGDAAGDGVVGELHVGRAVVVAEIAPGDAGARLEQPAHAA